MLFAVKKQTGEISARYIVDVSEILPDELSIDTEDLSSIVYDAVLDEVREMNASDLLERARELKLSELKEECTKHIQSGFVSNALGSAHYYDSEMPIDQSNIIGAMVAALSGASIPFTCADSTGYKEQRLHTATQLQQVFQAGMQHIVGNKTHYDAQLLWSCVTNNDTLI
jgi:hypothetical protein